MPGINQLGKYIVLEGGDGCGKDTQLPLIVQRIEALGDTVRTIREPYDSASFGEMIRDMLFAQNGQPNFAELPPDEQARFMNLARAEIVPMIAQAISLGEHVVVSRNWLSTMAYQGHEKGLSLDELDALRMLCEDAACEIRPDLVILLDLPVTEVDFLARRGPLQHVLALHGRKPAGAGKISGHDGRSVLRRRTCIGPAKGHHGNRYRLVHAGGDLDLQLGAESSRNQQQGNQCDCAVQTGSAHEVPDPKFQPAILRV